jgi:predicted ATP-binding protein involved in virulence
MWIRDTAGRRMALTEMSDGYRAALAMLIDLFRHMVNVYGPEIVARNDDNGHHYIDRPGVVLIDEIDAHLHPDWQREIGFWLKQHFPRVQFVVTTHSPLVCPAADGGRIYHLPQPGGGEPFRLSDDDYQEVIAGKPDEILLTPAFGMNHTRSPKAVKARERHALLVSKRLSSKGLTPDEADELGQLELFASVA